MKLHRRPWQDLNEEFRKPASSNNLITTNLLESVIALLWSFAKEQHTVQKQLGSSPLSPSSTWLLRILVLQNHLSTPFIKYSPPSLHKHSSSRNENRAANYYPTQQPLVLYNY